MKNSGVQISTLLISSFFVFLLSAQAQTIDADCSQWKIVIDTSNNYNFIEKYALDILPESQGACRAEILTGLGELLAHRSNLDSAQFYYNKSIQLSESIQAWDELVTGLCKKANLEISRNQMAEAATLFNRVKSILDQGHAPEAKVSYYSYMASFMDANNDFFGAITYTDSVLITELKDSIEIANSLHNKGLYYFRLGNYQAAIKQLQSAIEINQQLHTGDLGANYFVLGYVYSKTKQYKVSAEALEKALKISQKNNQTGLELKISTALVSVYRLNKNKRKSLEASEYSLSLVDKIDDPFEISKAYLERGRTSEQLLNLDEEALNYYRMSYETVEGFSTHSRFAPTKFLVSLYIKQKQFVNAKPFIDELIALSNQLNRLDYKAQTQEILSKYYEGLGQPGLALKHFKTFHRFNDSIANKEVRKQIAYYERAFDTKQKEFDILQLNEANRKQKEATLVAETLQQRYFYGALLLGCLFAIGAISTYILRRQKKSLEEAHQQLSELNNVKDRFFSIIAHDVRGMIVPFQRAGKILGYHIDKGNLDRAKHLSSELGKNANQLSDMLDNLLKWSLEQMEGYRINREQMNVKQEFETVVSSFQAIAQYKSTEIQLNGFEEEILFDKNAFHVIFRNLIGNALKFTENGRINVEWEKTVEQLQIRIADSGIGMNDDQLQELFLLGKKERKSGTKGEKGTGLGLHLVSQFVKRLEGKIAVESKLNEGTAFTLQFPMNRWSEQPSS